MRRCGWEQGVAEGLRAGRADRVAAEQGDAEMGEGRGEAFDEAGVAFAERVAKQNADGLSALRGEVG